MLFRDHISVMPFKQWLWKNKENRPYLLVSAMVILIQFIVFKYLYPFPNFFTDSYSYLEAAFNNHAINIWPVGYSKFLRLFSCFTNSHTVLVLFQYVFLQASTLYFLFSVSYLLSPGKWVLRILLCCSVLNPLLLYVSNFVSGDALFTALSLVWFTQLLWILYRPGRRLLVLHAVVLLLVFMVRYNALYYPFISMAVIVFSPSRSRMKLVNIGFILLLLGAFVGRTQYQYHKTTGTVQFSAFGGWQMAANALYAYAQTPPDAPEMVPAKFRALHTIVNRHMDSLSRAPNRPGNMPGIYYLWDEKAPLKKYLQQRWVHDSTTGFFKRWASMGPLYFDYGCYLIKRHPGSFIRHYVWPNLIHYYVPETEFLNTYNTDTLEPMAVSWFALKSNKVRTHYSGTRIIITGYFPVALAVINLVFVLGFIGFALLAGFQNCSSYARSVLWFFLFTWSANIGFSVLASPIVLRYQLFPMITTLAFGALMIAFIVQQSRLKEYPVTRNQDIMQAVANAPVQL